MKTNYTASKMVLLQRILLKPKQKYLCRTFGGQYTTRAPAALYLFRSRDLVLDNPCAPIHSLFVGRLMNDSNFSCLQMSINYCKQFWPKPESRSCSSTLIECPLRLRQGEIALHFRFYFHLDIFRRTADWQACH